MSGRPASPPEASSGHDAERAAIVNCARRAIDALDRAIPEPAAQLKQDVDVAEQAIAALRDCLIHDLRQAPNGSDAPRRRQALDQANIALSLVVGVEYPSGGIQRKQLEQARDVLCRARVDEL